MQLSSWRNQHLQFVIVFLSFFAVSNAKAKDLQDRMGLGLTNIGSRSLEAASLDWQITNATAFELNFGLDTQSNSGGWQLGVRGSRNLYVEDNMLFSLFIGAALAQEKTSGASSTGYLVETGIGSKFFMPGLPNLGFGFRAAFQVEDIDDLTLKIAPIFSMHYYF